MEIFVNNYGDEFKFTKQKDGNILWEGPFENCKLGESFVNPPGGPCIKVGQMISHVIKSSEFNDIVQGFEKIDGGIIIQTNKSNSIKNSIEDLHQKLFSEEYCYIFVSDNDPWSEEHTAKLNRRRAQLGVSPISSGGSTSDNLSMEFCEREIKAAQSNEDTEYTKIMLKILKEIQEEKLKLDEEIKARSAVVKGIDPENPRTWTETMINNSYDRMAAADRWELDTPMPFEDFKEKLFSDKDFARSHAPRGKMNQDDYNPWAT